MEMHFCQSCGMPVTEELLGTEANREKNPDYCTYCYQKGAFTFPGATMEQMIERWRSFVGRPQTLGLPSAPHPFLYYFQEDNRPQTRLDRDAGRGMAISIGRLRPDTQYDYKFVCLSHNTLRGAAGGAVLIAELLCAEGYMG